MKVSRWPVAIIGSLGLFIIMILFAAAKMMKRDVNLVAENYYEKELKYQATIDKIRSTSDLKKAPVGTLNKEQTIWSYEFPSRDSLLPIIGTIKFMRPSDAKMDFGVKFNTKGGIAGVDLPEKKVGPWRIEVEWSEGDLQFFYEERIEF